MIKLYGNVKSRAVRVLWLLEELGLDFEHVNVAPRSDDVKAVSPVGKVPALDFDGTILTDSVAIMTFLADREGRFTYPAGTVERAVQDSHIHFINDELDSILWTAARHSFVLPEDMRLPAIKDSLRWEYERSLARLSERLGDKEFLMGDEMTIADILAAHCLGWGMRASFPEPDQNLKDYEKRMAERPAHLRARARDQA